MSNHRLIHPEVLERFVNAPATPQWPSYTGASTLVGTTADGRCTVYYDASLGAACLQNAQDLLADAPRVMSFNDGIFGTPGGHVDCIVFALSGATDGTGGADHMGCDFQTGAQIEVCASFGQSARVSALFEAELSECSMNNQLCGLSTGEALSRWCAMLVSNNALSDFASAPTWFQDGMPNFVDTVDPTDQNYDSIGCGMAFLSWLMGSGIKLPKVAQTMVSLGDNGTLADADLYAKLGTNTANSAWQNFQGAIAALPNGVQSDDPFNAMERPVPSPAPPPPSPPPTPAPSPGVSGVMWASLAANALIAGVAAGETATQIKADVDAIPT